ncbi:hypothetical protein D3C77_341730 [compost metagenome]
MSVRRQAKHFKYFEVKTINQLEICIQSFCCLEVKCIRNNRLIGTKLAKQFHRLLVFYNLIIGFVHYEFLNIS